LNTRQAHSSRTRVDGSITPISVPDQFAAISSDQVAGHEHVFVLGVDRRDEQARRRGVVLLLRCDDG
jgi:hypothetical protein